MKTLKIFLSKSKRSILVSFFVILSAFLISTAATASNASAKESYELIIDQELCMGCGFCEIVTPEVYVLYEGKAYVIFGWQAYPFEYIEAGIDICPVQAISLQNY